MSDYKTFLCSYNVDGVTFGLNIEARSFEDAAKRLKAIGSNGRVDGELILEIGVPSFFERFVKWVRA